MIQTTEGVVLGVLKIAGGQQIVTAYTSANGRLSYIMRTPRSRKSPVSMSLLQPLSMVQIVGDVRPGATLQRITSMSCTCPYRSIPSDPYKSAMTLFLQEFLMRSVREEGQPNSALYDFITTSMRWLDAAVDGYSNFHIAFMLRISAFLGLQPNTSHYVRGYCFDLQEARYVPPPPQADAYCLTGAEAAAVGTLMRMNLSNMHRFLFSRQQRRRILSVVNDYYRLHIPDFPELRSLQVLHEVFD